jgi:hypothetical protein
VRLPARLEASKNFLRDFQPGWKLQIFSARLPAGLEASNFFRQDFQPGWKLQKIFRETSSPAGRLKSFLSHIFATQLR